ncbi:MAG: hypothetical protein ACK559_30035, partial [bacterium]
MAPRCSASAARRRRGSARARDALGGRTVAALRPSLPEQPRDLHQRIGRDAPGQPADQEDAVAVVGALGPVGEDLGADQHHEPHRVPAPRQPARVQRPERHPGDVVVVGRGGE